MSSLKDWKPRSQIECGINVDTGNTDTAIYFHGEGGGDCGKIWEKDEVLDFDGDMGACANILMNYLCTSGVYGFKKEDGSYCELALHPGRSGNHVTLTPGPYPEIVGPCSDSLREFLTVVNTLIIRSM